MADKEKSSPLTCKLTSRELQQRKQTVVAVLKSNIIARTELDNGFRYSFAGSDDLLDQLTMFIKTERQCCDFFSYELITSGRPDHLELLLTGPAGVKDFIKNELGM